MAEPHVRLAEPRDIEAVTRLTEAAYAPYLPVLGYPPVPVTEDYAPRIAAGEVTLLEEEGRIVALLVLEDGQNHGLIFSLAVAPGHQGRGLGTRLLNLAEERTRRMGYDEIRLYTNARMERNIAIYAAHGYAETGRRPNPKRPSFTIVDMVKRLG